MSQQKMIVMFQRKKSVSSDIIIDLALLITWCNKRHKRMDYICWKNCDL